MRLDAWEANALEYWLETNPEDIRNHIAIGHEWYFRKQHPRPHTGGPSGHLYDEHNLLPPPTERDIREIDSYHARTWKFERTVFHSYNNEVNKELSTSLRESATREKLKTYVLSSPDTGDIANKYDSGLLSRFKERKPGLMSWV
jgi:hypothetical protein